MTVTFRLATGSFRQDTHISLSVNPSGRRFDRLRWVSESRMNLKEDESDRSLVRVSKQSNGAHPEVWG
jgi:hypothetical protein